MSTRLLTIDGPAGCGKSTVARQVARALGGLSFSTGAIYRAVTLLALDSEIDLERPEAVVALLDRVPVALAESDGELLVRVDGQDPGLRLHDPAVTRETHWIADAPAVRDRLLEVQRELPVHGLVVAEGRDLGTVVFPDAPVKIFLTASDEARARRRHEELVGRGATISYEEVLDDVRRRDRFDRERAVAPLQEPPGAHAVDSTGLSVPEVVAAIVSRVPEDWRRDRPPGRDG